MNSISVIIPTLNEYVALLRLIPSLLQEAKTYTLEVIVCDAGSNDLTCPYIAHIKQQNKSVPIVLLNCERGRAQQMNAGALIASYQQLLFLHADTQLPEQWPELIQGKQWGRFDVRLSGKKFIFRVIEKMMNLRSCMTQVATGDQAIFVNSTLFRQVGGFPSIEIMEDIALSSLLKKHHQMACISPPLETSSRRWENQGVLKTILLMWWLRLCYFVGLPPQILVSWYYPAHRFKKKQSLIQIFSKLPVEGYVKTRLIDDVGRKNATAIHVYLMQNAIKMVQHYAVPAQLWLARPDHSKMTLESYDGIDSFEQEGADLGERMSQAIMQGLNISHKVMLMGIDCLDINDHHIEQTMQALETHDVVIVPALDGGFIAIACRVFDSQIFNQCRWGSEHALEDVIVNLNRLSLSYQLLNPVRDIDTFADVKEYPQLLTLLD